MKHVITLAALALLATACTVRHETVVEKPVAPAPAAAVVYTEPPPPTTVYVPVR